MRQQAKHKRLLTDADKALCDERITQVYEDLHGWIRYMAVTRQIPGHWYFSADDVSAEAYFVLVKVARVYLHLPYPEFKTLCKASIRNAIISMHHRVSTTHRSSEMYAQSLDEPADSENEDGGILGDFLGYHNSDPLTDGLTFLGLNPERHVLAAESFLDAAEQLSTLDVRVLDAVLGFDERVLPQLKLAAARYDFAFSSTTIRQITVNPLIVARALHEPVHIIEESFKRIASVMKENKLWM